MAFTSQVTGSPFTTPTNNINGIAYVNHGGSPAVKRIYYMSDTDFTKVFCMELTGAADTSREFTLNRQGDSQQYPGRGLASDGTYLYALVGTLGSQYIHKYRLSDRTYDSTHELGFSASDYARAIEVVTLGGTQYVFLLRNNRLQALDGSTFLALSGHTFNFGFATNLQVTAGNWQAMAWDSTTGRLLVNAEVSAATPGFPGNATARDEVFGFQPTGAFDVRESFLPGVDVDDMTYNSDDDDLYMIHETSTNLYVWGDFPRWKLGTTSLTITEGTTFTLDLKPLVDAGSVITARNTYDTRSGLQNASLSNGVFTWTNPPAPVGGASRQNVRLTFRATLGSNVTDQVFNFVLLPRAQNVVAPVFSSTAFPSQTVYEPYQPPVGAPSPSLAHGFAINLSDYLSAGTPPYVFALATDGQANFPGTFQLTQRFVNQQPVQDRLVFNASAVTTSQLGRHIAVTATNSAGSVTANIPIEVVNLAYPAWQGSSEINITDSAVHSVNLRDLSSGEPQADIDFVGTPPAALDASLTNGVLTMHPSQGAGDVSYRVPIKLTNLLTDSDGVQRTFDVNVARQAAPATAPMFTTDTQLLSYDIDAGAMRRIDLSPLITAGSPVPTYSISSATDFTNLGGTASIAGKFLNVHAPPAPGLTSDLNLSIQIQATNSAGSAIGTLDFTVDPVALPMWTAPPGQAVEPGETYSIDLNAYVTGQPTPTIAFQSGYPAQDAPNADAALANGIITWNAPADLDEPVEFHVQATNRIGTAVERFSVAVGGEAPNLRAIPYQEVHVGEDWVLDLTEYVEGLPIPLVAFTSGYTPPTWLTLQGYVLRGVPSGITAQTGFTIPLTLTNRTGSQNETLTLTVTVQTLPIWREIFPIRVPEGQSEEFNLMPFVEGDPVPTIGFTPRTGTSLQTSITNGVLQIVDAPQVQRDTQYILSVDATNPAGTSTTTFSVWVLAQILVDETHLTTAELSQVRQLIDMKLTPEEVTDDLLNADVIKRAAFDYVASFVPLYSSRTELNRGRLKRAVLYRMGGLAIGSYLRLLSQRVGETIQEVEAIDWEVRQAQLFAWADLEVNTVVEEESLIPELMDFYQTESNLPVGLFEVS